MAGESAGAAARRMRDKSERLARAAELWERGADGERTTATLLDRLPRDKWRVFHDLRWPGRSRANVDHVAVGPTGVFVIDSKNWSGTIAVGDGVLRQNGRLRQPAVVGAADAAHAVARVTTSTSPAHVHPVLCFVREEALAGRSGDVLMCSTANLLTLLQTRPPVLTEATQARVCRDIDESMRASHRAAPLGSVPRTPYRTIRRPRSARNRNGLLRRELGRLVGFVIGVVALLMLVGSGLPAQVAELLTSVMTSEGASDAPPPRKEPGDKKVKRNSSVEPRDRQHTPRPNR